MSLVLTGGGLALRGWLAKTFTLREQTHLPDGTPRFATTADLNGCGERVTGLTSVVAQIRELGDSNRDDIRTLQIEQRHQWERISAQIITPLDRITDRLEAVSLTQERQAATLEHIVKHVESLSHTSS